MSIKIKHPSEWDTPGPGAAAYGYRRSLLCGSQGSLPVEYLSGYQFLRPASRYRYGEFEFEGRSWGFVSKRVLVMGSDYIRLEGVPLSGIHDTVEERVDALKALLSTGFIQKIRYCEAELPLVEAAVPGYTGELEGDFANFHIDTQQRSIEIEKSRWRSQHGVNLSRRLGGVTFDEAGPADRPAIQSLFNSWVAWKAQHEKLMYRGLYERLISLIGSPTLYSKGWTVAYVLKFNGVVVGCTAWVINGPESHLLMNLSAHRAANKQTANTASDLYANLEKKIGYLLYYNVVQAMLGNDVFSMFLGWCGAGDPLLQFKQDMSHNTIRMFLSKKLDVPTPTVTPTPRNTGFGLKGK